MIPREMLTRDPACNQKVLKKGIQHMFRASAVSSDVGKPKYMNSMYQVGGFVPASAADALITLMWWSLREHVTSRA